MLTKTQIAEHMLSDVQAYKDYIINIFNNGFKPSDLVYWSAWFEGAEGIDLENADRGIEFKK